MTTFLFPLDQYFVKVELDDMRSLGLTVCLGHASQGVRCFRCPIYSDVGFLFIYVLVSHGV